MANEKPMYDTYQKIKIEALRSFTKKRIEYKDKRWSSSVLRQNMSDSEENQ